MTRKLETFPNLVAMFFERAREKGERPFLWHKAGNAWQPLSWNEVARQVSSLSNALKAQGFVQGDRIALVSENRPEWCVADLAIMAAGCITVPTYITNTERDHLHILENSGAKAVFVSTPKLAHTLMPAVIRSADCRMVIGFEPLRMGQVSHVDLYDLSTLMAGQTPDVDGTAAAAASSLKREDLACIIYTSGTGGAPRGVRQHHGGILHNVAGCVDIITSDFPAGEEVFLSFLPLSHAYEHSGGQFFPIAVGGQIYYAESLERLAANIAEVRPTIMIVVPRLFEVLRARVTKAIEKQGAAAAWMLAQTLRLADLRRRKGRLPVKDKLLDAFLERVFRPKVRQRFGGRIKALVSGGAPLNADVGMFFDALGLPLLQGYGQTEASPVISCNRPAAGIAMETVGPPLKGVELRIADDGEILVRGELVMHGYWREDADTARALQDGWLHTGDIGRIDRHGRLVITDRKKDIIVNDKGDNVAPQRVEGMLTLQPEIHQAMVYGDRRPHLVALVVPDPEWADRWAAEHGVDNMAALASDHMFQRALLAAVDRVNANLSVIERVRRIAVADEPFTVENEQLTPSMKIRRHVLRAVYAPRLDALY